MASKTGRQRDKEDMRALSATSKNIRYCSRPLTPEPVFSRDLVPGRLRAILETENIWVNGTVLHYYFFDEQTDGDNVFFQNGTKEWRTWVGGDDQKAVVRKGFELWKNLGIGLKFEEVGSRNDAEIRIGFMQDDGSWSWVGRYILKFGASKRTMNFGWDLTGADGLDTATHEIGHTLGFDHEHQNPNAGIVWYEEAVYAALAKPPNNWSRQTTYDNIIRKISPTTVQGSSWDPDSIMEYVFVEGLIKEPAKYSKGLQPRGGLSDRDNTWVRHFYPPLDESALPQLHLSQSQKIAVKDGEQQSFVILPDATRYYNFRIFGTSDTIMVLFEDEDGNLRYRTADNDSGEPRNAGLTVKLIQGHKYVLRIRVNYSDQASPPAVMMW